MFDFLKGKIAKTIIKNNSDNNVVLQNNTINNSTLVINSSAADIINVLKSNGQYDAIQTLALNTFDAVQKSHPLFPDFSAKFDNNLRRVISTPETEDALKKYPKNAKGAFSVDYRKYPKMSRDETPWDYAYRTQTRMEFPTTSYQEYLGEIEDPFPTMKHQEGMITVIEPPSFPPAIYVNTISGNIKIQMLMKRIPCLEYKRLCFEVFSKDFGLNIILSMIIGEVGTDITFTRNYKTTLESQLMREKLLDSLKDNPFIIQTADNKTEIIKYYLTQSDLNNPFFTAANSYIPVYQNLIVIEKFFNCKFNTDVRELESEDFELINLLYASINNKWYYQQLDFDSSLRCSYNNISNIMGEHDEKEELNCIYNNLEFALLNINFECEEYHYIYKNVRINNIKSVNKNNKRKKDDILITLKPYDKNGLIKKYSKLERIKIKIKK